MVRSQVAARRISVGSCSIALTADRQNCGGCTEIMPMMRHRRPMKTRRGPNAPGNHSGRSEGEAELSIPRATADVELEAAFAYALALAPALPLDPISKRPLIAHGYYSASADRVELARWWRKWPNALFALRTGLPGGIAVLDLDPRHGVDLAIADRYATRKHRTRSGGIHAVFRHRSGLRSSAGRIAPGVDVRADPGCVVWWPVHGFEVLCEGPIAEWPDDLAQVTRGAPPSKGEEHCPLRGCSPGASHIRGQADRDIYLSVIRRVPLSGVVTRRVHRRMIGALDVTACKSEGERNAALFWSACQFGEMIGEGLIDWEPRAGYSNWRR